MKQRVLAIICVAALLGAAACSSSGDPINPEISIEADVSELMGLVSFLIGQFPITLPGAAGVESGVVCTEVGAEFCDEGGIQQCPPVAGNTDVHFDCRSTVPGPVTVEVSGTLTYVPKQQWPSGTRDVLVTTADESWAYGMTFNGTELVLVNVLDLINNVQASCIGNLSNETADCTLVQELSLEG